MLLHRRPEMADDRERDKQRARDAAPTRPLWIAMLEPYMPLVIAFGMRLAGGRFEATTTSLSRPDSVQTCQHDPS
jgi:hypothetical protein